MKTGLHFAPKVQDVHLHIFTHNAESRYGVKRVDLRGLNNITKTQHMQPKQDITILFKCSRLHKQFI